MKFLKNLKGRLSAHIIYPLAEHREKRVIRKKVKELNQYYQLPFSNRKRIARERLHHIVSFAGAHVPYYRDLFREIQFDCEKLKNDAKYIEDIPCLTKDIIREQGDRLLSRPLADARSHTRKTGGSTGLSCHIYYDQEALDYSAAVTLFARASVGKRQHHSELHFASRFPEVSPRRDRFQEYVKCLSMNRSNIFFDALDDKSLESIWETIKQRKPFLVHGHPSTLFTLACFIEKTRGADHVFSIFESSGELLYPYMREKIKNVFSCRVVDRYGLAELGIMAYEKTGSPTGELFVLDSEGWIEILSAPGQENSELTFTGLRNHLMPLIRYRTGDLGVLAEKEDGFYLSQLVGRIHDMVSIQGIAYPTHYIQDVLDRVGGIQEFQVDLRHAVPKLLLVAEPSAMPADIEARIKPWWGNGLEICFVQHHDLIRVGNRAKFRHVVKP